MYNELITEYEQTLIGRRYSVLPTYFCYKTKESNEVLALQIMKYVFETYLKWDPETLRDMLTWDILKMLKLDTLMKYIQFPPEIDPETDLFYIAWKIYPKTIHISDSDLVLKVYKGLLERKSEKYPKEFFTGIHGFIRAKICFKYMVEHNFQFSSPKEAYKVFAGTKAMGILKKYKLHAVCKDLYGTPLDFLHNALSQSQRSEFLLNYYKWQHKNQLLEDEDRKAAAEAAKGKAND